MLIDTHVHLNADQYDEDLEAVIERARENGVDRMFVVGFDTPTVERTMELILQHLQQHRVLRKVETTWCKER